MGDIIASTCAGRIYCKIYRDKRFCHSSNCDMNGICNCIHAVHKCEIGHCGSLIKFDQKDPRKYTTCEIAKNRKLTIYKEN